MLTQVRIGPPGLALWNEVGFMGAAAGGDVTAPVLSSPGVTEIFSFGCYASLTSDTLGEGTIYAVVTVSGTAPSVAQIQAGQDNSGAAAAYAGSWTPGGSQATQNSPQFGGLAHDTSYYIHYQQEDAAGNDSTVVTSAQFTTDDALPTGVSTGETTATGTLESGFNSGVAVYYVVTESATTPSIAQIQAGQDHLGAAADASGSAAEDPSGSNTFNATGLTAGTTYYFHYQYENEDNVDAPAVSSSSFTTDVADVTAPVLSLPTGAATSASTGQGTATTDEGNGTFYWVVTQSATQPSVVQIQAGQDHTGSGADASSSVAVTVAGIQTVNAGGLAASTGYYFHFQQEDAATNDSNRVSSTEFTTDAASSDDYELRFRDATYRRRLGFRGGMG